MRLPDDLPLGEARKRLRDVVDDGDTCPCCGQMAKVYRRTITASMARALAKVQRVEGVTPHARNEQGYVKVADFLTVNELADFPKLRYWGLIAQAPGTRDDGSPRVGYWRITPLGLAWLRGEDRVISHVRVYNGRSLGLDGDRWLSRDDVRGFDYAALMAGITITPS